MEIISYIPEQNIDKSMDALQALPVALRPDRFSVCEEPGTSAGKMENKLKFDVFVKKNRCGFFLFSEKIRYNINTFHSSDFRGIDVDVIHGSLNESEITAILCVLLQSGAHFVFAAEYDEYCHRNKYIRRFDGMQVESWVGRDLRKYLPGIYWMTALPKEHANCLPSLVSATGAAVTQIDSGHWLVKAYDNPANWLQYAPQIDEWLSQQPTFFSKRRILSQLDAAPNYMALSEITAEWR